jgi:hypothetical protein
LTTVTVTAVDAQTGRPVPGATVYVNATEQAPANKAFPYSFKCQRRTGMISLMVCDEVVVSAPDYRDATVNWKEVDPP